MRLRKVLDIDGVKKGIALSDEDLNFYEEEFYDRARDFPLIADDQPENPKDDGHCYDHARKLALDSSGDLHYVDGFAGISEGVQTVGNEDVEVYSCVPHAWCVNRKGEVIDPTWDAKDQRFYFGIPISTELVFAHQQDRDSEKPTTTRPVLSFDYLQKGDEHHTSATSEFERWLE